MNVCKNAHVCAGSALCVSNNWRYKAGGLGEEVLATGGSSIVTIGQYHPLLPPSSLQLILGIGDDAGREAKLVKMNDAVGVLSIPPTSRLTPSSAVHV